MAGQRNSYSKRSHSHDSGAMAENGGSKRRNRGDEKDQYAPGLDDTVYRYLCPGRKIGSIIGRGGEIVKMLRAESQSKIKIGDTVPGCEERVVTIFSSRKAADESDSDFVCPAQDALFRVHERIIAEETADDEEADASTDMVTARLLVPSDQIGCVIGKGGQIIQNLRTETGAQIRILKNEHLPQCAMNTDELLQISGEASVVKKALQEISSRLHENPSRSQHLLSSNMYQQGRFMGPNSGGPVMGMAPFIAPFGGYKGDAGNEWSLGTTHPFYPGPRDEGSAKEFALRMLCPTDYIGGVIGKGGVIIKQIRQESRALIKVDSSSAEDDCIISISSKEYFEDPTSPTIDAAVRLQPKCSEKTERENGDPSYTTRLLVPTSRIGCLIGKGGSIITEMRRLTRANIRIFSKENLPKVASEDDEMVQISGELDVARNALMQVAMRLKANYFEREGAIPAFPQAISYDAPARSDSKSHGKGYSYSGGYGASPDAPPSDNYGNYGSVQSGGGSGYGYGGYSSGRSSGAGSQNPSKHHGYGY